MSAPVGFLFSQGAGSSMEELPTGRLAGAVSLRFRWKWVNAEMQQENVSPSGLSFLPSLGMFSWFAFICGWTLFSYSFGRP